jgi:UDP-N-acetylglucosamine--N-acetylmuramyl-(pentapeptide) pyrophosphoryl-undecaprenol N-acetylglucosamine transferase
MALNVVLACGGTGGHVFPALAAGAVLRDEMGASLTVFGRSGALEERLAANASVPFRDVPAVPLHRSRVWRNLALPLSATRCVLAARKALREVAPDAVLATGGFVSLPTGLAARTLGIPVVVHESNAHPGVANRLMARIATRLLVGSPAGAAAFAPLPADVVGNPARRRDERSREALRAERGLGPDDRYLVVIGGSQGARGVNAILAAEIRDFLASGWKVLWQTGPSGIDAARAATEGLVGVQVSAFVNDVYGEFTSADLALTRAGASTLAELALFALPSVLVPFPSATGNHQEINARELSEAGACELLVERDWVPGAAKIALERLWSRRAEASASLSTFSRQDAAHAVARVVLAVTETSR